MGNDQDIAGPAEITCGHLHRILHGRGGQHLARRHEVRAFAPDDDHARVLEHLRHHEGPLLAGRIPVAAGIGQEGWDVGSIAHRGEEPLLADAAPGALFAAGRDDEVPSRPDDAGGSEEQVGRRAARLVEVAVLREAHPADGDVVPPRDLYLVDRPREGDEVPEGSIRVPRRHTEKPLVVVQHHVENETKARPPRGLRHGVVERVPLDPAEPRARVIDERRAVGVRDQGLARRSDRQRLAASRVAGVLVRLHDSGRDDQVGLDDGAVHRDRHAPRGGPEVGQRGRVLGLVVDDPKPADDPGAELRHLLGGRRRAMHAHAAQQRDVVVPHAGLGQLRDQGRHQQLVGARPRGVREDDADAMARPRHLAQPGRADRSSEGLRNGCPFILQRADRVRNRDCRPHPRGQRELQGRLSVRHSVHSRPQSASVCFIRRKHISHSRIADPLRNVNHSEPAPASSAEDARREVGQEVAPEEPVVVARNLLVRRGNALARDELVKGNGAIAGVIGIAGAGPEHLDAPLGQRRPVPAQERIGHRAPAAEHPDVVEGFRIVGHRRDRVPSAPGETGNRAMAGVRVDGVGALHERNHVLDDALRVVAGIGRRRQTLRRWPALAAAP